uniref:Uncharacterized protein n=1 Tax=Arundo donax TaxID=35708 RepID=A0A0A9EIS5_ARUDO
MAAGDLPEVWWGGVRDGSAPRRQRRHRRVPLLPDVVGHLQGGRRRRGGAAVPRPDPPPGAVAAVRLPRRAVRALPDAQPDAGVRARRQRGVHHPQGPARSPQARLRRREHLLLRERPRVAVRVHRQGAVAGGQDSAHPPGQRPPRHEAAAAGALLRQRPHIHRNRGRGARHHHGGAGHHGEPDQGRRRPDGRRGGAVGDRLLRAHREGRPAGAGKPAGDGAEGGQLARYAGVRRRLRMGEAGAVLPCRIMAPGAGVPDERRRRRRARGGVR